MGLGNPNSKAKGKKKGMRIKELRDEKKLTQRQLAKEIGVSNVTVMQWENGIITPKLDKLIKLSDYFGVSIDYLVGRDERETLRRDISRVKGSTVLKAMGIDFGD